MNCPAVELEPRAIDGCSIQIWSGSEYSLAYFSSLARILHVLISAFQAQLTSSAPVPFKHNVTCNFNLEICYLIFCLDVSVKGN